MKTTTCTMQTVEQNAIINKVFIKLYNHAKQYMSEPLAEQFTQDFCSEVKPTLIRLTQQQDQQADPPRPFKVGDIVNILPSAKVAGIHTPTNPCKIVGQASDGDWKVADGYYPQWRDPQPWYCTDEHLEHAD